MRFYGSFRGGLGWGKKKIVESEREGRGMNLFHRIQAAHELWCGLCPRRSTNFLISFLTKTKFDGTALELFFIF